MKKLSKFETNIVHYTDSWYKPFNLIDFIIDGKSLLEEMKSREYDFIPCIDFRYKEFQKEEIERLLLINPPDLPNNRYSLFICPCTDLECGCISISIERDGDKIIWKDFREDMVRTSNNDKFKDIGPFAFLWSEYESILKNIIKP